MNDGFGLGPPRRFRPDELDVELEPGEESELMSAARDLEWLAAVDDVGPSWDFTDRVMVSIRAEPLPRPVIAAYGAARKGRPIAALAALGDLWRVAFGGGSRPLAVRLPAIGLVIFLLAAIGGAGTIGVGALTGAFNGRPSVSPVATPVVNEPQPTPTQLETPRTPEPSEPSPRRSAEPSASPEASPTPDRSEEPGDDTSSTSAPLATDPPNTGGTPRATPPPSRPSEPSKTPRPTDHPTHWPRQTPQPTDTPRPTEGHGGGGGGGGGGGD